MKASQFFNDRGIHDHRATAVAATEGKDQKCPRCDRGRLGKNGVCGNCWHQVKQAKAGAR